MPFERDGMARAYVMKGDLDRAIAEYQRLITIDPASKERFLIHPVYHYRLGKLCEEAGSVPQAVQELGKFVGMWSEADPDRPELADARVRLARLRE